jgi:MOSC domain-containing protein YiiM
MSGRVEAIFVFPQRRQPASALDAVAVSPRDGIAGDRTRKRTRQVTLLAIEDWRAALREIGGEAPPEGRRANFVVSGVALGASIGGTLRIGEVVLRILGENEPCRRMEELLPGLRAALVPGCRAGVVATVERGGLVRVGDAVTT